jgi:TIR domain
MPKLFFSYSHHDETTRDELEIHLAMLKRQGVIESWHDRRIVAGDEFAGQISEHLEEANIVLLLVSPYFLASIYCYDVEMKRAMERHQEGTARVIPVIVDPCDWHHTPFGKLLAMPLDGKPISKFPNIHDAFLQVTNAIRDAARPSKNSHVDAKMEPRSREATLVNENPRSSNLR